MVTIYHIDPQMPIFKGALYTKSLTTQSITEWLHVKYTCQQSRLLRDKPGNGDAKGTRFWVVLWCFIVLKLSF